MLCARSESSSPTANLNATGKRCTNNEEWSPYTLGISTINDTALRHLHLYLYCTPLVTSQPCKCKRIRGPRFLPTNSGQCDGRYSSLAPCFPQARTENIREFLWLGRQAHHHHLHRKIRVPLSMPQFLPPPNVLTHQPPTKIGVQTRKSVLSSRNITSPPIPMPVERPIVQDGLCGHFRHHGLVMKCQPSTARVRHSYIRPPEALAFLPQLYFYSQTAEREAMSTRSQAFASNTDSGPIGRFTTRILPLHDSYAEILTLLQAIVDTPELDFFRHKAKFEASSSLWELVENINKNLDVLLQLPTKVEKTDEDYIRFTDNSF